MCPELIICWFNSSQNDLLRGLLDAAAVASVREEKKRPLNTNDFEWRQIPIGLLLLVHVLNFNWPSSPQTPSPLYTCCCAVTRVSSAESSAYHVYAGWMDGGMLCAARRLQWSTRLAVVFDYIPLIHLRKVLLFLSGLNSGG